MKQIANPIPNFIVFIIFISFIACTKPTSQEEQTATQSSPNITQVAIVEAKEMPFALQLLANGRVSAQGRASLQFKVSGMTGGVPLERIAVSNGQSVFYR